MNRDKQIQELTKHIYSMLRTEALSRAMASMLYIEGYRKTNEPDELLLINDSKSNNFEVKSNIPAVKVRKLRHGEWAEENKRPKSSQFICSVCEERAYYPQPNKVKNWKKCCPYKYCPNCGAKMDGERSEK